MAAATISNITASSSQDKIIKLLIAGEFFDLNRLSVKSQTIAYQKALEDARLRFGHALCQCRRKPLKLQIRLRDAKYHLAVWPEEGQLHDSTCMFFREDEQLSPRAELRSAVKERENGTHEIDLTIAFDRSASKAGNQQAQQASRLTIDNHKLGEQASLRGLTNLLWGEANLTRWHPKWSRDWGRTRYELLRAAASLTVRGVPLNELLFVPRPYRENVKEELNHEWDRFVGSLARGSGDQIKSALLVAPVRKLAQMTDGGYALHLRHLRSPIGLSDATVEFLGKNNRTAMRRLKLFEEIKRRTDKPFPGWVEPCHPEVIAFLHVEASSRGGLWARGAWIMAVHPSVFIPASNIDEIHLIDALIDGKYEFSRIVSSEQPSLRTTPNWIVRHVSDPRGMPVAKAALEILNSGSELDYLLKRVELADQLGRDGVPVWTWTPTGRQIDHVVPPLPPHDDMNEEQVRTVLTQIETQNSVTYAFGSGRMSHNTVTKESLHDANS